MDKTCPRCGKEFRCTEDDSCFLTCPACRRPDKENNSCSHWDSLDIKEHPVCVKWF